MIQLKIPHLKQLLVELRGYYHKHDHIATATAATTTTTGAGAGASGGGHGGGKTDEELQKLLACYPHKGNNSP
jgi:hypothetical protein